MTSRLYLRVIAKVTTIAFMRSKSGCQSANIIFPALYPLNLAYSDGVASVIYKDKA